MRDDKYLARLLSISAEAWNLTHKRGMDMFTLDDYVGTFKDSPDWNEERRENAVALILICGVLQSRMEADGVHFPLNPKTGTTISGEIYGGFRPQDCPIGAPKSAHKEGLAVDRYDPDKSISSWLMTDYNTHIASGNIDDCALVQCGVYIEMPSSTPTWCHWQIKKPNSGSYVFIP